MRVGTVIIGRNEGERLRHCLKSVLGQRDCVIYVDSGSTDGSVETARAMGAEVVRLDSSLPFTAARGRNAGFARLQELSPGVEHVQFVDGDCELVAGWRERAAAEMGRRMELAAVCGRLRERHPERSIYNRLCQLEWDGPTGEVRSCGGIAMYRVAALREVGAFNASVSAGEEPELCARLRARGWKILRVDAEMALHDAAMMRFGQWWKRQVRGGRGAMDLVSRLGFDRDPHYAFMVRTARRWAVGWPAAILSLASLAWICAGAAAAVGAGLLIAAALPAQMARLAIRTRRRGADWHLSSAFGFFTMLGKWPALLGQVRCWLELRRGQTATTIEDTTATP